MLKLKVEIKPSINKDKFFCHSKGCCLNYKQKRAFRLHFLIFKSSTFWESIPNANFKGRSGGGGGGGNLTSEH